MNTVAYAETTELEYESIVYSNKDIGSYEEMPAGNLGISLGYVSDDPMHTKSFSIVDSSDNRCTEQKLG